MSELTRLSAAELAAAMAAGEVSAEEVAQAHLDRIEAVDGLVRAFLHVDVEGALAAARRVDADRAAGRDPGPLAGVPLAMKDVVADPGPADDGRLEDPRRLDPPVRRHDHPQDQGRGHRDARQDEHGRVRDGLVDGELRVPSDPQSLGSRSHPGWFVAAGRPRPCPPSRRRSASGPTPEDLSGSRPLSPASSGTSPHTAACRATA